MARLHEECISHIRESMMPFNQNGNFKLLYNLKTNSIALSAIESRYTVDIELKAISYIPPGTERIKCE